MKQPLAKSLYTNEWAALCSLLKQLREDKPLTQIELSDLLKQPQSFVSKVERGERKLDLRQFVTYVRALEADPIRVFRRFIKAFDAAE